MRRLLVNSCNFKSFSMKRHAVRFNSNATLSDQELQESYGLFPRIMALEHLIYDSKEREKFFKLVDSDVITPKNIAVGLKVFSDLQNPLLKKYKFDPSDFLVGATEAFCQVQKAMASQEFSNFIGGYSTTSEADALLKSALSPVLYKSCRDAIKSIADKKVSVVMTDVQIKTSMLAGVSTEIYDAQALEEEMQIVNDLFKAQNVTNSMLKVTREKMLSSDIENSNKESKETDNTNISAHTSSETSTETSADNTKTAVLNTTTSTVDVTNIVPVASAAATDKNSTPSTDNPPKTVEEYVTHNANGEDIANGENTTDEEQDEYEIVDDSIKYPHGAVVASVDVYFVAKETYRNKKITETEHEESEFSRISETKWTFDGCISGQSELDWHIVAFDGLGQNSTARFVKKEKLKQEVNGSE